jgi:hypothetical protein
MERPPYRLFAVSQLSFPYEFQPAGRKARALEKSAEKKAAPIGNGLFLKLN